MTSAWKIDAADYPASQPLAERIRFLVRYGVLAPSSHNSQPWRFQVEGQALHVYLDRSRWLPVADSDARELHISVGCAIENVLIAAEHFELAPECTLLPVPDDPDLAARIEFTESNEPSAHRPPELFAMLTVRHTNRRYYEGRPILPEVIERLRGICVEPGIAFHIITKSTIKSVFTDLVVRADELEQADPAYRKELGYWIGKGVFKTGWLKSQIGRFLFTYFNMAPTLIKLDKMAMKSAPAFAILASAGDDHASQLVVGQVYQRICLLGASLDVWCQPMSQLLHIPTIKSQVQGMFPVPNMVPQHPFRMGYSKPEDKLSTRRPFAEVFFADFS